MRQSVSFSISGDFVTETARDAWREGNEDGAIAYLEEGMVGIDRAMAIDICIGRKKLVGVNELSLEDDDKFEDPVQKIKEKNARIKELEEEVDTLSGERVGMASPWGFIQVPRKYTQVYPNKGTQGIRFGLKEGMDWGDPEFEEFRNIEPDFNPGERAVEVQKELKNIIFDRIQEADIEADAEEEVKNFCSLTSRDPEPAPDPVPAHKTLNGWISPEGDLYPCLYMGHNDLAEDLEIGSREIEDKGWIKISDSQDPKCVFRDCGDIFLGEKPPTLEQRRTAYNWCRAHGREFPRELFMEAE